MFEKFLSLIYTNKVVPLGPFLVFFYPVNLVYFRNVYKVSQHIIMMRLMRTIYVSLNDDVHRKLRELKKYWREDNIANTISRVIDEAYIPIEEAKRDE